MKTLLRYRHPLFVEVFGRKSNLVIPIDGPAVEGVVAEILRILESIVASYPWYFTWKCGGLWWLKNIETMIP